MLSIIAAWLTLKATPPRLAGQTHYTFATRRIFFAYANFKDTELVFSTNKSNHLSVVGSSRYRDWCAVLATPAPVGDIPEKPFQLYDQNFPKWEFGLTSSSLLSILKFLVWQMKWIHYDATNDLAFCHLCMMGAKSGKMSSSSESAFIF